MLALMIFAFTLFGILRRPFGLGIWVYSSVGAVLALILNLVNLSDLRFIFSLIWDSSLTLIGLIIISLCLEALGFFEWLIFYTLRLCQNAKNSSQNSLEKNMLTINTRFLFIIICFLCALCSSILANDGAILIFTPLVLGLFLRAKRADFKLIIAFLFAVGFICDISSNPLIISNLTNIITANFHQITFTQFAKAMFLPNLLAFLCALLLFLLVFRKILPENLNFRAPSTPKLSGKLFLFYLALLALFVLSFFILRNFALPLSVNCLAFALILVIIVYTKSPKKAINTLKNAPFSIIIFVFGLFVVVFSVQKLEIEPILNALFHTLSQNELISIVGVGTISAILASIFNNLPMVLFGNLAIDGFFANPTNLAPIDFNFSIENLKQSFIYANLLGCNIGSKLTPIGSLCTLLWLSLLTKKGIDFSFKRYFSLSLIFTLPVLFCALVGLWFAS